MALVIFSHGKESGPKGTKINYLSEIAVKLNFDVLSIDYRTCSSVDERVALLHKTVQNYKEEQLVLVGSSMGGYVSTVVANTVSISGLFLMCPAFYLPNYPIQSFDPKTKQLTIVHGWQDVIVPYQNSVKFGELTAAKLHLIDDNHRLSNSAIFLKQTFSSFLNSIDLL